MLGAPVTLVRNVQLNSPISSRGRSVSCGRPLHAQKQTPAVLVPQPIILLDSVVAEQWPAMPPAVNAPAEITVLNPGQCVRVGVAATGTGIAHFLDGVAIRTAITMGNTHNEIPLEPASTSKLIRPEGADFVEDALAAGGVRSPLPTTATLAVSSSKWCVPQDVRDGSATFSADVDLHGKHIALKSQSIRIESLATAAAVDFKDKKQLGEWIMSYDRHPEPARLLAAVKFIGAEEMPDLNGFEFLVAAFAHDSATACQFGTAVAEFDKRPRLLAVSVAAQAKVTFVHPPILNRDERDLLAAWPQISDPYDLSSSNQPWQNLDRLWAQFLATGEKKPIAAIVQTLEWKSDYDAFLEMKKQGKKISEVTPSIAHGLTYSAAQWSLGSFYNNDPIAADYIRAIRDDPSTHQPIRAALQNLNAPSSTSSHN